jgi:hypothetical protein
MLVRLFSHSVVPAVSANLAENAEGAHEYSKKSYMDILIASDDIFAWK